MKVCFCTPQPPYPPISGGRVETFRLIEGLVSNGHEVTVVTYDAGTDRIKGLGDDTGCSVHPVPDERNWGATPFVTNITTKDPLPITRTQTDALERAVGEVIREEQPDVLHLHTLQMSYLAREEYDIPTVVRFTNAKSNIYDQFSEREANPIKSLYAKFQATKTRWYEAEISRCADMTLAITTEDRKRFEEQGGKQIETLPAGIDVGRFQSTAGDSQSTDTPVVTFFGSLDYHPNEDAAVWFAEEIFPQVRREYPEARFDVVGKDPPESVQELKDRDGIRVTGFVENIYEYVGDATVVVVPIRVGTGVRIKILHALAMGKPVVSTATGMQGIPVEDGEHAIVRSDADGFGTAVIDLLRSPESRATLGRGGRSFVGDHYSRDVVAKQLATKYESLLEANEA